MQQALVKAGHSQEPAPGVEFVDHMEHQYISTQGFIFAMVHWMSFLKNSVAKANAQIRLDFFNESTLGAKPINMIIGLDNPAGTMPTAGVAVQCRSAFLKDTSELEARSPLIKSALANKGSRKQLVEGCSVPGNPLSKQLIG